MKVWIVFEDTCWETNLVGFDSKEKAFAYLHKLWKEEIDVNSCYQPILEEDFNNDKEAMIKFFIEDNSEEVFWYKEVIVR